MNPATKYEQRQVLLILENLSSLQNELLFGGQSWQKTTKIEIILNNKIQRKAFIGQLLRIVLTPMFYVNLVFQDQISNSYFCLQRFDVNIFKQYNQKNFFFFYLRRLYYILVWKEQLSNLGFIKDNSRKRVPLVMEIGNP